MAGVDLEIALKPGKAVQGIEQLEVIALAEIGPAGAAPEKRISGEERILATKRHGPGEWPGVSRTVKVRFPTETVSPSA
jgi:hypothetical protein